MSRVQLALNVADLDAAVDFYSKLFATEPAKVRPGYANFAIADPPLKLVLIENPTGRGHGTAGALNHLGVEVETPEEVQAATRRLSARAWTRRCRSPPPVATPSRTRSGWTTPTVRPGRCTRCWPTPPRRPDWVAPTEALRQPEPVTVGDMAGVGDAAAGSPR